MPSYFTRRTEVIHQFFFSPMRLDTYVLLAIVVVAAQSDDLTRDIWGNTIDPRCPRQFSSLCDTNADCGNLNGFRLECSGAAEGRKQCFCAESDKSVCRNTSVIGVPQFGSCSNDKPCANANGYRSMPSYGIACGEPLKCVPEMNQQNSSAICHTCGSCKEQNEKSTDGNLRFNCTAICPPGQGDSNKDVISLPLPKCNESSSDQNKLTPSETKNIVVTDSVATKATLTMTVATVLAGSVYVSSIFA